MSDALRRFLERLLAELREFIALLRDPEGRGRFFVELRPLILIGLVLAVFGVFLLPPLLEWLADVFYPPIEETVTRRRAFGRRVSETVLSDDPRNELFAPRMLTVYRWFSAAAVAFFGYRAARRASRGEHFGESDSLENTIVSSARTLLSGINARETSDAPPARSLAEDATMIEEPASKTSIAGRYRIKSELGRGGMGIVHLAEDENLHRDVALKELPAVFMHSEVMAERFRVEARALARLSHPGIVQVYDLIETGEGSFMAMEFVRGGPLDEYLNGKLPLSLDEFRRLAPPIARALQHAHEAGVIHRDLKPANILISEEGEPKITDFGLAKMHEGPKLTQAFTIMGSPAYMSPEQASGEIADARSDIYSLGCTFFEMITGRLPFETSGPQLLLSHLNDEPPRVSELRPELPAGLAAIVDRMLAKPPEDRPSLDEVVQEISRAEAS